MKNWQESRNYRRIKDENGAVIANIITINGVDVEVSEEVFLAYSQSDRRERIGKTCFLASPFLIVLLAQQNTFRTWLLFDAKLTQGDFILQQLIQ